MVAFHRARALPAEDREDRTAPGREIAAGLEPQKDWLLQAVSGQWA
ncbi:hypothetical protein Cabther_A1705 [Chloracidobacterium thermophilum B]|uniref:Uncharacterized protein n=1 Tax=Chloracidobacterium thermophilum (strain B) TaxID=981222 RepID=G2LDJ2_CHLTF|nr:hypothetical protein Cabther_A1705 [Chloracidobacterium thermophilum B]